MMFALTMIASFCNIRDSMATMSPEEAARATKAGALVLPELEAPEGALSAPTEVHLNLTERCPAACTGEFIFESGFPSFIILADYFPSLD